MVPAPLSLPPVEITTKLGKMNQKEVMAFLADWRALECSCCDEVFGFQHKSTGALYCVGGCLKQPPGLTTAKSLLPGAALKMALTEQPVGISDAGRGKDMVDGALAKSAVPKPTANETPKPTTGLVNGKASKPAEQIPAPAPKPAQAPATILKPIQPAFIPTQAAVASSKPAQPAPAPASKPAQPAPAPASKPAQPAPAPTSKPAPKRYMWTDLKYSDKLLSPTEPAHVMFVWGPITYLVAADGDEAEAKKLQLEVNTYVRSGRAKPMDRPPIVNELAIGAYDGEYYRARVVKVSGDKIEINFIDFGDKKECKYTEIFPVNDEIMKFPVFGMVVELKLPMPLGDYQMDQAMEESLYAENYLLGFNKKDGTPVPGGADAYEVRLWDMDKENTFNEKITEVLSKMSRQ